MTVIVVVQRPDDPTAPIAASALAHHEPSWQAIVSPPLDQFRKNSSRRPWATLCSIM